MDCAQINDLIARGLSGNAAPADEAALAGHVAACASCAASLDRARRVWALMGRLPEIRSTRPAVRLRRVPAWAFGAAAAAALLVVSALWLLRPQAAPVAPVPAANAKKQAPVETAPSPEQVRTEQALQQAVEEKEEKEEQVKAPEPPAPPAPPLPAPREAPVVKAPEPAPAPVPAPKPAPVAQAEPAAPKPPARDTLPTAAVVDKAQGQVFAVVNGERSEVGAAFRLTAADGLVTGGKNSQAVLAYPDGTRVALGADTVVATVLERKGDARRIHVQQGVVAAQVARQAAGESLSFLTPTAEARVIGTRLTLLVTAASTRLEVKEGRVKLIRKDDEATVDVGSDHYAVAAKGTILNSKAIPGPVVRVREDFERNRWSAVWAPELEPGQGIKLAPGNGLLSFQVLKAPTAEVVSGQLPGDNGPLKKTLEQVQALSALGAKKDWPRAAALETKGSFEFGNERPLRIRMRAWHSHADADRVVWLGLNRGVVGQGFSLERRGDELRLSIEGAPAPLWKKTLASVKEWESLELWVTRDRIAVRRDGLTVAVEDHPVKAKALQVSIGTCAKAELAQDGETRIDDVDVSWLTKSDFEQISR